MGHRTEPKQGHSPASTASKRQTSEAAGVAATERSDSQPEEKQPFHMAEQHSAMSFSPLAQGPHVEDDAIRGSSVEQSVHQVHLDVGPVAPTSLSAVLAHAGSCPHDSAKDASPQRVKRDISGRSTMTTMEGPLRLTSHEVLPPVHQRYPSVPASSSTTPTEATKDGKLGYEHVRQQVEKWRRQWEGEKDVVFDVSDFLKPKPLYTFQYHKKPNADWQGGPLHVACSQPSTEETSGDVVETLLHMRANVKDTCHIPGTRLFPLHLAAGVGNAGLVEQLIKAEADPNQKGYTQKSNGPEVEHYTPLHEAVYFANLGAIQALIANRADVNFTNKDHQTPLHIAAKAVNHKCTLAARLLVQAGANKGALDGSRPPKTPLTTAIITSFPRNKLHMLAAKRMDEILEVAELDAESAADLMKDKKKMGVRGSTHESWKLPLAYGVNGTGEGAVTVGKLVRLLEKAPRAAADLLEVLTGQPKVQEKFYHPLPLHAQPNRWGARRCIYEKESTWVCGGKEGDFPQWHTNLLPGADFAQNASVTRHSRSRQPQEGCFHQFIHMCIRPFFREDEVVRVHVKVLLVPCIVNTHVLFQLTRCDWTGIFSAEAVQALLDFCWTHLVRRHYIMHFVYRALELLVLVLIAKWPPKTDFWRDACWSLLCTTSSREILMEIMQFRAHHLLLRNPWSYFGFYNLLDVLSMSCFAFLIWSAWESRDFFTSDLSGGKTTSQGILAAVCFLRWVQILYMMRAFEVRGIGIKVVPLFQSFFNVGGIFFVTMLLFLAISHSFMVLDPIYDTSEGPTIEDTNRVVMQAFRMLFAGDGDGINYLLSITGKEDGTMLTQVFVVAAYTTFGIFTLNLFIAVHGAAFNEAEESALEHFYKHRASICLSGMMQPTGFRHYLPDWEQHDMMIHYIILIFVAPMIWIFLISNAWTHPLVPSLVFCTLLRVGDRMLLSRTWRQYIKESPDWLPTLIAKTRRGVNMCRRRRSSKVGTETSYENSAVNRGQDEALTSAPSGLTTRSTATAGLSHNSSHDSDDLLRTPYTTSHLSVDSTKMYLWWCGWKTTKANITPTGSRDAAERAWVQSTIMDKLTQLSDRMTTMESNMNKLLDRRTKSGDFDLSMPALERGMSPSVVSTVGSLSRKYTTAFKSPDWSQRDASQMTPKFTDSWHGALHAQHVTDLAAKTPKSATSSHSDHGG
mmetsp:Transcript_34600/g.79144  ORF Transcript_34600/g.79144 Transcript_34600/m.79144 type:complete len:1189 (-) Transcript_34600:168-3734(-)